MEIVAERPSFSGTRRTRCGLATQEDIENLPIRGVQNIVALRRVLFSRAATCMSVAVVQAKWRITSMGPTPPIRSQRRPGPIVQEAIEELQLQSGGYTAEYGGSSSGIVRTNVRTGGSSFKASLDYLTDDFAKPGNEFLGTSSFGYRNVVATLSGPRLQEHEFLPCGTAQLQPEPPGDVADTVLV